MDPRAQVPYAHWISISVVDELGNKQGHLDLVRGFGQGWDFACCALKLCLVAVPCQPTQSDSDLQHRVYL